MKRKYRHNSSPAFRALAYSNPAVIPLAIGGFIAFTAISFGKFVRKMDRVLDQH